MRRLDLVADFCAEKRHPQLAGGSSACHILRHAKACVAGTVMRGALDHIASWVIEQGLKGLPLTAQFDGFCGRVAAEGFPMVRASMSMATLHPRYGAHTFVWRKGQSGIDHTPRARTNDQLQEFRASPIFHMRSSGEQMMRRRLNSNQPLDFPVLEDLRRQGMTDYAARLVVFDPEQQVVDSNRPGVLEGVFFSCATDRPQGFDEEELASVADLLPYMAMAVKSRLTYDVASTVLETYLGADAGHKILTGRIDRGSVESIRAVIWLCDLRDYTRTTDRLPRAQLVDVLDDHLEVMARPVMAHGGQILKFLGDGFLATFDLSGRDEASVCTQALAAAGDLRHDFAAFGERRNKENRPVMGYGLGLHLGEVFYGNIGASDRLDFTVIGPAVNEASRIEALCRPLDCDIVISGAFRKNAGSCRGQLKSIGQHLLRGVREPQELFTMADD